MRSSPGSSFLHDRVEDDRGVFLWGLLPDEVAGIDDLETARLQALVEELCVGERNHRVVAAVDDRDGVAICGSSSASFGSSSGYLRT
jgi:hypothetical protein